MKKKIMKLLGLIICFLGIIVETKAETFKGSMGLGSWTPVYLVKNGEYQQGRFIIRKEDGAFLYCLQPFMEFDESKANLYEVIESEYAKVLKLTEDDWEKINLLAYFGYGYAGHSDYKWYTITQVMIWKIVDKEANFYFTNTLNGTRNDNLYVSEMNELNRLVDDYLLKPDFEIPKTNLDLGESITIPDNNKILHNYHITKENNVTARIDGDSLIVNSTGVGSASVELERTIDEDLLPPVVYFKDNIQNVFRHGKASPVKVKVSLTSVGGGLNIHKVDTKGNSLEGVKFGIYNAEGNEVCTIITDSGGDGNCDNLPLGAYTVRELETIEGYVKNDDTYTFEITSGTTSVNLEIENKKITGFIEIYKIDKENNSAKPQGDAKLNGAVYGIYNSLGEKVDELVTNEYGYAKSQELEYGKYTVKELKPSEGYIIDANTYSVNIDSDGIVIGTTSKEQVLKFDFKMLKVESDGTSGVIHTEPNAVFDIFLKSKKLLVGTTTTDDEGKAKITLPYGVYNVCQIKGSDEAGLSPCFEINISNDDVSKVVNNGLASARLKVIKVDQDNKEIPILGIKFKIKNLNTNEYVCQTVSYPNKETYCEFETNKEGILITPFPLDAGDYELEEMDQYIEGYLWNPEPLKFSIKTNTSYEYDEELGALVEVRFNNTEVKGMIELYKLGEKIVIKNGKFTYVAIPLPNITFGLYDELGNLIKEYTTDENGYLKIENLKLGKYILKELNTLDNYVLDDKEYIIELKYKDQYTPVVTESFTLKNYLKKGDLVFSKTDVSTGKEIPNVKIEIYTENDELIFTGYTNEEGKIILENLFVGKFYIIETEAATGYLLSDEKVYFEIQDNGDVVKANMFNEKIKGDLEFIKEDEGTKEGLPNTLIEVYDALTDELVFSGKTDEEGKIVIKGLEYGKYYILEKEAPIGYVLNSEKIYFEILENNEVVKVIMQDKKITSKIKLHKIDENGNPLIGVKFDLYDEDDNYLGTYETDDDGNIELDLEYGIYYFIEKETISNYELNSDKQYFEVTKDGEVIELSVVNIKVPDTLASIDYSIILGGLLFVLKKKYSNR